MQLYLSAERIFNTPAYTYGEGAEDDRYQDLQFICRCQCEAEQVLLAAIQHRFDGHYNSHLGCMVIGNLPGFFPTHDGLFRVHVRLQPEGSREQVHAVNRTNLRLSLTRYWVGVSEQPLFGSLFVEISDIGQFETENPIPVAFQTTHAVRLSTAEILADPYTCVEKVHFMLDEIASQVLLSFVQSGRLEELIMGPRQE